MLGILNQKQNLADSILHGNIDETSMDMPSGRGAMMERLNDIFDQALQPAEKQSSRVKDPVQQFQEDVLAKHQPRLDLLSVQQAAEGKTTLFAVTDKDDAVLKQSLQQSLSEYKTDNIGSLKVVDRQTYEIIQSLIEAGILSLNPDQEILHESPVIKKVPAAINKQWLSKAKFYFDQAQRKQSMAQCLINGGFCQEATQPLKEIFSLLQTAVAWVKRGGAEFTLKELFQLYQLPKEILPLIASNEESSSKMINEKQIDEILAAANHVNLVLEKLMV